MYSGHQTKPLVLAVDDEEINLFMIKQILSETAEVEVQSSGNEALDYLANHHADLVLLDYKLQDIDGIEVLKALKTMESTKQIPVMVLTADQNVDLEAEMFKIGAVDFIRKPFLPAILQARTQRILENEYLKGNLQREVEFQTHLVVQQLEVNHLLFKEMVLALAQSIDAKDKYTQGHSRRVAEYSRILGKQMSMDEQQIHNLYYMGLLHDIGKIGVPETIINKRDKLTDEEFSIIKSHTVIGFNILKSIVHFPQLAKGARHHHERYDGKGYPDGLKAEDIPLEARIIAVADAYDAMTSNRSYRNVMEQSVVRAEIEKGMATQFDPEIAALMIKLIDADHAYHMHE